MDCAVRGEQGVKIQGESLIPMSDTQRQIAPLLNPTGAIYQADARTGQGTILVPPPAGRMAAGMAFDAD